jgi:succinoglycan biosynthesis transport protein ExoP
MSIVQFMRTLWARRLIILAATISCLVGGLLVTRILPPRWEASSRILLDLMKPDPVTGQAIASQATRAYVATQAELIQDYSVAGQVVDQIGWLSDPNLIRQYEKRPKGDTRDFRRWLAQIIMDGTKTKLVEGSNIMEIVYSSNSQNNAKAIADAIRQAYLDTTLSFRREEATRNATWYQAQADKAKAMLDTAERAESDFERQSGVFLADDKTDLETARLRALAGQVGMPAAAGPQGAAPGSSLAAELTQIDAAIAQASQSLGPNHPDLQAMRAKRAAVVSELAQERANAAHGVASGGGPSLESTLESQKSRVLANSDKLERLRQMQAEVDLRREQFDKTSSRAAEYSQEAGVADTGMTPLGSAISPSKPAFPNVPLIVAGSLGLGLAMGVLVALLVELMGRRVRGPEDLLSFEDAPLLAVISTPTRHGPSAAGGRKMLGRMGWPGRKMVQA